MTKKFNEPRFFTTTGREKIIILETQSLGPPRMWEHKLTGETIVCDFSELESRLHAIHCNGSRSRADCYWCAPTPVARRIFRAIEQQSDRDFLARVAPQLL